MRSIGKWVFGALLACGPAAALAAWQNVGAVTGVSRAGNAVILSTESGAKLSLAFVSADVVHVRMAPNGKFSSAKSYALVAGQAPSVPAAVTNDTAQSLEIRARADGARVLVHKTPRAAIEIFDAQGHLVVSDDPERSLSFDPDTGEIETSKRRALSELYYGFGEVPLPQLSRHQQSFAFWNTDQAAYPPGAGPIYQTTPFFIALNEGASYGLFFDNTWRSHFDMGQSDPARYRFGANGGELDYYVFIGGAERSPANVLRAYGDLVGRTALPPLWALGYQQSRYSYMSQTKVEEIAHTFREKKIPADVIYLDIDYMDGYRIFTWSPKTFPQPKAMLDTLHANGFRAVTIVDPGVKVDPKYSVYQNGRAQNVFVHDAAGDELHATVWPGMCAFPDFTDAKVRSWWGALYAKPLREGVDGFWNDMNEPATFPSDLLAIIQDPQRTFPLDVQHAGDGTPGTHARYHNIYGMQMARATWEGLHGLRPDQRPLVLTRAGYAGVQRYAAVWTGDNVSSWEHLALTIPMLTNLSASGVAFVGADVGGFMGTPGAELYTRWLQAAVLTPFLRTHSAIDTAQREPWSYGADYERINRATIELRYRLLPYIYTLFAAHEAGAPPPLRPLWFAYPHDPKAALVDDQYLAGGDILVAPVLHEGETERRVYFPVGDDWIDWWDGTRHAGGSDAKIAAPIERLPLFVRVGASVPTQAVVQHTGEMAKTPLNFVVALGANGGGTAYQDAGDGYAYRKGASRTIKLELSDNTLRVNAPAGARYQRLGAIEFLGLDAAPKSVRIDGRAIRDFAFDAASKRLRVPLPNESVREIALER
jgi:alpha-glucosidase